MIIDLSHTLHQGMPVYPGTPTPKIYDLDIFDEHGVYVKYYEIDAHIGTHLDTPMHLYRDVNGTASFPIEKFYGKAKIVDCTDLGAKDVIDIEKLKSAGDLSDYNFVIFKTDWCKKWGSEEYFKDYPVLNSDAIEYLLSAEVFGIGLDNVSIDKVEDPDLTNHKQWLSKDKIIIENLTNLDAIGSDEFILSCFPLKIDGGDGSPVRAVAII